MTFLNFLEATFSRARGLGARIKPSYFPGPKERKTRYFARPMEKKLMAIFPSKFGDSPRHSESKKRQLIIISKSTYNFYRQPWRSGFFQDSRILEKERHFLEIKKPRKWCAWKIHCTSLGSLDPRSGFPGVRHPRQQQNQQFSVVKSAAWWRRFLPKTCVSF